MTRWTADLTLGRKAPDAEGLYAIYLDGRLAYIGQSKSLKRRISSHALAHSKSVGSWGGQVFSHVALKFCLHKGPFGSRVEREHRLIYRLSPYLNLHSSSDKGARDLVMNTISGMHLEYG